MKELKFQASALEPITFCILATCCADEPLSGLAEQNSRTVRGIFFKEHSIASKV